MSLKTMSCGCRMGTVGDAFVMEPCAPNCEVWLYAKAEAARQGKPLVGVVDPALDVADPVVDQALRAFGFKT